MPGLSRDYNNSYDGPYAANYFNICTSLQVLQINLLNNIFTNKYLITLGRCRTALRRPLSYCVDTDSPLHGPPPTQTALLTQQQPTLRKFYNPNS